VVVGVGHLRRSRTRTECPGRQAAWLGSRLASPAGYRHLKVLPSLVKTSREKLTAAAMSTSSAPFAPGATLVRSGGVAMNGRDAIFDTCSSGPLHLFPLK